MNHRAYKRGGLHAVDPLGPVRLEDEPEFKLGDARVRPALRLVECDGSKATLEPLMMQVLVLLAARRGTPISRHEFFERCWNNVPVGDDSLNRIIAGLRKVANGLCGESWAIETIKAYGYVLHVMAQPGLAARPAPHETEDVLNAARNAWRIDAPVVPKDEIAALQELVAREPDNAPAWAMLAYMLRLGAEYCELAQCSDYVLASERAAERALRLAPADSVASTALVTLRPIFGDWSARHRALSSVLDGAPTCVIAQHELAILEMASGRIGAATILVEQLLDQDQRAPALLYKRVYHLWSAGALGEMDRVADAAVQLWPQHLAIGLARFWSFLGTDRAHQAEHHLAEMASAGRLPSQAVAVMQQTIAALSQPGSAMQMRRAVELNMLAASRGPAQSVAAMIHLALLGAIDEAFAVAHGYYLRTGEVQIGLARSDSDPVITDQTRRVTQLLFIPATAAMRADLRFADLMRDTGLAAHWDVCGLAPDYLAV